MTPIGTALEAYDHPYYAYAFVVNNIVMKRARFRASMLSKTAVTMADYCKSITTASMCLPLSLGMWLDLLAFVFVSGVGLKSPVSSTICI